MSEMSIEDAQRYMLGALRRDLSVFTQKSFRYLEPGVQYLHNWHIDAISEYLMACHTGDIKRLIVNIPPRYMKSLSITVAYPAWALGNDPAKRFLCASYSSNISKKLSIDCRTICESRWFQTAFPEFRLRHDQNTKERFMTDKQGMRMATSITGSATGDGADVLIADDPLNPKQAGSDVERRRVNEWFDQTFTSRLNNKREGVIIVVQQRLHPDDLTGHLLEKGGWEHLNIPAISPERQTITFGNFEKIREEGDVLHEAREDKEMLDRMRRDMGTHVFQSQYQQNPRGTEGAMVNLAWFPRYEKTSEDTQSIVLSWDFAQKVGQENDFTACTVWGVTPNNYQLLHVYNRKLTFGQAREFVKLMDERWEPQVHLMEDKSAGTAIIQDLKETTTIPIVPMLPGANDKASRLLGVVGTMESGVVELPKDADWLLKFEEQLCDFPNVKHDDMVDTMTQFLRWAIRKNRKLRDLPAPVCVGGGVDTVLLI